MDCWNAEMYHGATASEDLAFWTWVQCLGVENHVWVLDIWSIVTQYWQTNSVVYLHSPHTTWRDLMKSILSFFHWNIITLVHSQMCITEMGIKTNYFYILTTSPLAALIIMHLYWWIHFKHKLINVLFKHVLNRAPSYCVWGVQYGLFLSFAHYGFSHLSECM